MRILLDESLPHDLAALILGHQVSTVSDQGWKSVKNGKLLALAASKFDVFITADRNLEHQQNLAKLPISVVVMVARKKFDLRGIRVASPFTGMIATPVSPRPPALVPRPVCRPT